MQSKSFSPSIGRNQPLNSKQYPTSRSISRSSAAKPAAAGAAQHSPHQAQPPFHCASLPTLSVVGMQQDLFCVMGKGRGSLNAHWPPLLASVHAWCPGNVFPHPLPRSMQDKHTSTTSYLRACSQLSLARDHPTSIIKRSVIASKQHLETQYCTSPDPAIYNRIKTTY